MQVNSLEFEFEKYELTKEQLKGIKYIDIKIFLDLIYEEILLYHF